VAVRLGLVPTRTTFVASPALVTQGTQIALTATVTVPAPGYGTPADSVRFFDGTTLLGTSPVIAGVAVLATTASRLGERSLTAVYKGDGKLFGSNSPVRTVRVVSTTAVPGGGAAGFALEAVRPNPAAGWFTVTLVLSAAGPAKLEVFDVSGRRVLARDVTEQGPGRQEMVLGAGRALPSGIYLVRLSQAGRAASARVVMMD
jgi:hypothetical protein